MSKLEQVIQEKQMSKVIATTDNLLHSPAGEKLVHACHARGVWVRVLCLEFELTE